MPLDTSGATEGSKSPVRQEKQKASELTNPPANQEHAGEEDRRITAYRDPQQNRQYKRPNARAAKQRHHEQRQNYREGGVERSCQGLQDAVIDDLAKRFTRATHQVLTHSIEHND